MKKNTTNYKKYNSKCNPPVGYHRFQSNICDQEQDELPITLPKDNYDTKKPIMDKMFQNIFFQNSLSCRYSSGNEDIDY